MHTVIRFHNGDPEKIEYIVVHQDRPNKHQALATFTGPTAIDDASHYCNRLNGGFSSEFAALLTTLQPFIEQGLKEMRNGRG